MAAAEPWTLTARWIFPVDRPPLENGVITIRGEQIEAVEPRGAHSAELDLGNAAVLPAFVNAHTHLDLSDACGKMPPTPDFTEWLRQVIEHRRTQTPEQVRAALAAGVLDILRSGTTLIGDIAAQGASWPVLASAPLRAVVFYELIGLSVERAQQSLALAHEWFQGEPYAYAKTHGEAGRCRPGFSPHAPYSFRAELLDGLARAGNRLAIHLAESAAETELLEHRTGSFVPFLKERGVWDPTGLPGSYRAVVEATRSAPTLLYVHANHLSPEISIPPHAAVVYCPRTHAAFGHPPHPFRELLRRGIRVALGTDSLASNPDLDILAEARFLAARYPDFPGAALLRMLTLSGAEALGWREVTGSLTPGKSADLVVLPLPNREAPEPHRLIFEAATEVQRVLFCGQWTALPRNASDVPVI